jgi:hypothetical protein
MFWAMLGTINTTNSGATTLHLQDAVRDRSGFEWIIDE